MKRIVLAVLVILTLTVSSVFAGSVEVEIRAVPYELQKYIRVKSGYTNTSVQGFGGMTGVNYVFDSGFDVGLQIGLDSCTYDVGDAYRTNFDGTVHAKVGVATPIDARIGFDLDLGFGVDVNSDPEEGVKAYPSGLLAIGFRLKALAHTDGFALSVGMAFKVDWEVDKWVAYGFMPYFGIDYKF